MQRTGINPHVATNSNPYQGLKPALSAAVIVGGSVALQLIQIPIRD